MRKKVGKLHAGGSAFTEGKLVLFGSAKKIWLLSNEGQLARVEELVRAQLSGSLLQLRLVIEKIQVGWRPYEMNVDYSLRLGGVMQAGLLQRAVSRTSGVGVGK